MMKKYVLIVKINRVNMLGLVLYCSLNFLRFLVILI